MKVIILVLAVLYTAQAEKHYHSIPVKHGVSGSGSTSRYWDCCKPSCSWSENLKDSSATPVTACNIDGSSSADSEALSACVAGGTAYMCVSQQPKMVNSSFALGYAAASFAGGTDVSMCCACIRLDFQGEASGKSMIVQVTNTGNDLSSNQFDIAIPGGGVGQYNACSAQWGCPSNGWGEQYGGISSQSECDQLPSALQPGCNFRFEFFGSASNPPVSFEQVECPGDLTGATGCSF